MIPKPAKAVLVACRLHSKLLSRGGPVVGGVSHKKVGSLAHRNVTPNKRTAAIFQV